MMRRFVAVGDAVADRTDQAEAGDDDRVVARISAARRVLAVSHENPDADTLGATLGVVRIVEALGRRRDKRGWTRLVIEKPFGHDLESARALNQQIREVLDERLAGRPEVRREVESLLSAHARAAAPFVRLNCAALTEALGILARFRWRFVVPAAVVMPAVLVAGTVRVVATSALRDARNSQAFLEWVRSATGWTVDIISGLEEAHVFIGIEIELAQQHACGHVG